MVMVLSDYHLRLKDFFFFFFSLLCKIVIGVLQFSLLCCNPLPHLSSEVHITSPDSDGLRQNHFKHMVRFIPAKVINTVLT